MTLRITITNGGKAFQKNMAGLGDRINRAIDIAAGRIQEMWLALGRRDIAGSGNFGESWTQGLQVQAEGWGTGNMRLWMTHKIPFASIHETGGVIHGKPLLWIPLSGTDAVGVRAAAFGDLFAAKYPRKTGRPLLFARSDKLPRYFGIEEVTIPKRWHLSDDANTVMQSFHDVFAQAMKDA